MAASSTHETALRSKHAGLEARLQDEQSRPVPDDRVVKSLKVQKLRIKEELARM
jgi:hypothetical protein